MSELLTPSPDPGIDSDLKFNRRVGYKRGGDTLGIAWLNHSLHIVTFRKQQRCHSWVSPTPVVSLDEFAAGLDRALMTLEFGGTETFLILAHDEFAHQAETAPGFSEGSARSYLRGRMARIEQESGPMLWVGQRCARVRNDAVFVVHRVAAKFYHQLNTVLLARRLDLGRILPVVVPIQQSIGALDEPRDLPILAAATVGTSTVVVVTRPGGELLFARTILESWQSDPDRVAVEINRSILYARQQYASTINKIWLFGNATDGAQAAIAAKCGGDVAVMVQDADSEQWLAEAAQLPLRHPVNLVATHLRTKRQVRFARRVLLAACWLGLFFVGIEVWQQEQNLEVERARMAELVKSAPSLEAEYERLARRNEAADRDREFHHVVTGEAMPPVAGKFLAYVATLLPAEGRLTNFSVRWDEDQKQWMFRMDGVIDADVETARTLVAKIRRELLNSPLGIRLAQDAREPVTLVSNRDAIISQQRFAMEGGLFAH